MSNYYYLFDMTLSVPPECRHQMFHMAYLSGGGSFDHSDGDSTDGETGCYREWRSTGGATNYDDANGVEVAEGELFDKDVGI